MTLQQTSHFLPYRDGHLHVRHIVSSANRHNHDPILMLHGAMSNGKVFYSESGKGLGCFLAKAGFDVYVMDTAGRGLSKPIIDKQYRLGQGEVIREQLPQVHQFILDKHPLNHKVHWCAHSWGGVLMASCMLRFEHLQSQVASYLTFGTKRTIKVNSLKKWLLVDMLWNRVAPLYASKAGYLDAQKLRIGMDNESKASLDQTIDWVRGDWVDHDDGFDYSALVSNAKWPKTWFIAAKNDRVLGNPSDVKDMLAECQLTEAKYTLLAKYKGYKRDYDHASMLTHPDAVNEHFIQVKQWYLSH
ncbi:alpha/beta fold hydrolase [Shewanella maritima]|uniref:alpha/beta fold hydrolase n=1 Tax=Shewanella maritima TaxID=2520507 RepID=UPI00373563DF